MQKTIYTGRSSVSLHPGRLKWLSWLDWTNVTQSGGAEQEIMLMVFTVSQLCGGKRCLRDKESVDCPCQVTCGLSFCFPWNCFLPQRSSSSAVFDLVFSLPVLKREWRRARFHVGVVTTWDTVSGLLHGWSTCSSTHRVSSSSVRSFSLPNFNDLNSKTGTAQNLPGMWSSYFLVLKLSSYTSAAHVMKVDSYTNNLDQQLPMWQKQMSDLYQLGRGWAII